MGPFRYEPENSPGTIYSINVVPFQRGNSAVPVSALLTAEDLTQTEQLRKLEVEAENLRLIKSMADRMAHEIGNTMVPLSTHQQLLAEKYERQGIPRIARPRARRRRQARHAAGQPDAVPRARRPHRAADFSGRKTDRRSLSGGAQTPAGRGRASCNTKNPASPSTSPATAPRSSTRCPKSCSTRCRRIRRRRPWMCACTRTRQRRPSGFAD